MVYINHGMTSYSCAHILHCQYLYPLAVYCQLIQYTQLFTVRVAILLYFIALETINLRNFRKYNGSQSKLKTFSVYVVSIAPALCRLSECFWIPYSGKVWLYGGKFCESSVIRKTKTIQITYNK